MSLRKSSVRSISGCDAYARAEGHLVERTSIGAISECGCRHLHSACCHVRLSRTCILAGVLK